MIRAHRLSPRQFRIFGRAIADQRTDTTALVLKVGRVTLLVELPKRPSQCRECQGTPQSCLASRIKCCPDCTHTREDLQA